MPLAALVATLLRCRRRRAAEAGGEFPEIGRPGGPGLTGLGFGGFGREWRSGIRHPGRKARQRDHRSEGGAQHSFRTKVLRPCGKAGRTARPGCRRGLRGLQNAIGRADRRRGIGTGGMRPGIPIAARAGEDQFVALGCAGERRLHGTGGIFVGGGDAHRAGSHRMGLQSLTYPPGIGMIAAGRVPRNADGADLLAALIEREPSAEHVDPADALASQGIVWSAVFSRVAEIGDAGVHRIAVLQAVQAAPGLGRAVQVCGGNGIAVQAEGIGRIGLLGRDHAAAQPFLIAREQAGVPAGGDLADLAGLVDQGHPHFQAVAAGSRARSFRRTYRLLQGRARDIRATRPGSAGREGQNRSHGTAQNCFIDLTFHSKTLCLNLLRFATIIYGICTAHSAFRW
ncbi:protein of unknown function (plasmid) [Candidatus Methylocalor cossyra]|uniref:Uncharacterized protein n=1 Tax=Candidatus Methylocalor cossyra TaxID=3108543 RepID=A0ABM9NMV2_9GAMM